MTSALNIFFLVFAAIFPVVNPPGSALVFLGLTRDAAHVIRRILAWRVARNSFFVLVCSFFLGALVLKFYGISIPVLRVAGGFIVAVAGWKLLNEGRPSEPFGHCGDRRHHLLVFCLCGSDRAIARAWGHRHRRTAVGLYPLLPWCSDSMVRRK